MVRAGSACIVVFCTAMAAKIVIVWILVSALGTLRHLRLRIPWYQKNGLPGYV